jgi:hypothetical protein
METSIPWKYIEFGEMLYEEPLIYCWDILYYKPAYVLCAVMLKWHVSVYIEMIPVYNRCKWWQCDM